MSPALAGGEFDSQYLATALLGWLKGQYQFAAVLGALRDVADAAGLGAEPFVLLLGRRADGSLFWYRPGKGGRYQGWTPEAECVRDLTTDEVLTVGRLVVEPDWQATPIRIRGEYGPVVQTDP